jgi:hypothetical protein
MSKSRLNGDAWRAPRHGEQRPMRRGATVARGLFAWVVALAAVTHARAAEPPPLEAPSPAVAAPAVAAPAAVTPPASTAPASTAPASTAPASTPPGAPSAQEMKDANDPLASMASINLQNYYAGRLSETPDASADNFVFRLAVPFGDFLMRASLPVVTTSSPGASASGLGDLNVFVTWKLSPAHSSYTFGVGPLYVAPTATEDALGSGKHQLGAAVILLDSIGPLLVGTLLQYQHSVAGDADRAATSVLIPQVFAMLQVGGGTYLRSAPIATFDLESGNYNVPFGLGIGHVVKVEGVVVNAFIEPQYTLLSSGPAQPLFQVFSGVNLQVKL